jgi:hypothetical protein
MIFNQWTASAGPYTSAGMRRAGFVNDQNGNWMALATVRTLTGQSAVLTNYVATLTAQYLANPQPSSQTGDPPAGAGYSLVAFNGGQIWARVGYYGIYASVDSIWYCTQTLKTEFLYVSWGVFDTVPLPPVGGTNCASALLLLENTSSQAVVKVPQNWAYWNYPWIASNALVVAALGNQVIPVIADNTVELNNAEVNVMEGTGGVGAYEHIITTGLDNASLATFPVDG